jgi:hypothetical protein
MMAEIYATSDVARDVIQNAEYFSNPAKAIAEYVWNSLDNPGPGQAKVKCQVIIMGVGKDAIIDIRDNASGMSKEELNNFFRMHGENIARKKGRKVRGRYGTGKCAAFGIADSLSVETVKNGKRNVVRLTRKALVPGLHQIPVEILVDNKQTNVNNGTIVRIEKLRIQRLRRESIRRFLEKAIGRALKTHDVYWGPELLAYEEPRSIRIWKFKVPSNLQPLLGDVDLQLKAAQAPLEEEQRGISIIANEVVHEITLLSSEWNPTAWRLFGEIDAPLLDSEDPIPAYDNTRSLRLNEENERVKRLHTWLDATIKTVAKELEEEDNKKQDKEREKALQKESTKIEEVLNKDFREILRQLESKPLLGGSGFGTPSTNGYLGPALDHGELPLKVRAGEGTPYEKTIDPDYVVVGPGSGPGGGGPSTPSQPTPATDSKDSSTRAKERSGGTGRKLPRGGFRVTYKSRGPDAPRARYDPAPIQQIEINLDYPELASAGSIESPLFQSLSYEIAIGEYASAVVQMMVDHGYVDAEDSASSALYQWRTIVNRLGKAIATLIRISIQRAQTKGTSGPQQTIKRAC